MGKRSGKLVSFKTSDGKIQKAIAYDDEQSAEYSKVKRVFVRYIGDDFMPLRDKVDGQKIVGLKEADSLTIFGFVD